MPKIRGGRQKFDPDLALPARIRTHVGHLAHLLRLGGAVRQPKLLTFYHFSSQGDERAMRVHNQGMCFFFERLVLRSVFGAHRYSQAQDHALTAPAAGLGPAWNWIDWGHVRPCYGNRGIQTMVRKARGIYE